MRSTLFLLVILFFTSAAVQADIQLSFGVYARDKPTAMAKQFQPLMKDLEQALSIALGDQVRIRMQVASSYDKGIEAIASGLVDFAQLGPASYVEAKARNEAIKLLAMESKGGTKTFNGVICVASDSAIRSVDELKGKRFAFGNELSTIGRYLSQRYLLEHGIRASDLSDYEYVGRHDAVGQAVAAGKFDAGALKEGTFKRQVAKGVPLRAIARFPNVTKPWVVRAGIEPRVYSALRKTLLEYRKTAGLEALGKDGFLEASDQDYASIRIAVQRSVEFYE